MKVYASVDSNAYTFEFHTHLIIQWPIKSQFLMFSVVGTVFFSFFFFFTLINSKDLFHMHPNVDN